MRPGTSFFALILAGMASAIPSQAAAADELKFEITPFVAYRFGGDFDVEGSTASYSIDDSEAFGLLFNLRQSSNTQWEVLYSRQNTTASLRDSLATVPSVDMDIHVLQIGGTYQGSGETVRPYLAMTLGGTYIKTTANGSQNDTFFSGSIGAGVSLIPSSRLGIRLEARAYGTLMNANTDLFCQTGPDMNVCAIRIDGSLLSQFEIFAGVIFRF
jgi:hypothetical protein